LGRPHIDILPSPTQVLSRKQKDSGKYLWEKEVNVGAWLLVEDNKILRASQIPFPLPLRKQIPGNRAALFSSGKGKESWRILLALSRILSSFGKLPSGRSFIHIMPDGNDKGFRI